MSNTPSPATITNQTQASAELFLFHKAFAKQVRLQPSAICMVIAEKGKDGEWVSRKLSYAEINARANKLAHFLLSKTDLHEKSALLNKLVAILSQRPEDFIIGTLAAHKVGAGFTHISSKESTNAVVAKIKASRPDYLLFDGEGTEELARNLAFTAYRQKIDKIYVEAGQEVGDPEITVEVEAEALAYVMFTSGTTTQVTKPIDIPHRGIGACLIPQIAMLDLKPEDRLLHVSSVGFGAHLDEIFLALSVGASLYALAVGNDLEGFVNKYQINKAIFVPSMLKIIQDVNNSPLSHLMIVGEKYTPQNILPWLEKGSTLINGYGTSENTICISLADISKLDRNNPLITAGRSIAGTRIFLVPYDEENPDNVAQELKYFEGENPLVDQTTKGRIYVAGIGLARGYRHLPKETEEYFKEVNYKGKKIRAFRTSDVAELKDNQYYILYRLSNLIKLRAQRIHPEMVENAIMQFNTAKRSRDFAVKFEKAIVMGVDLDPQDSHSTHLVAYIVVANTEFAFNKGHFRQLRDFLKQHLASHEVPTAIKLVSEQYLQHNHSGKTDRASIKKQLENDIRKAKSALQVLPFIYNIGEEQTAIEDTKHLEELKKIWRELIPGIEEQPISPDDEFVTLGGNSLAIYSLPEKVKQRGFKNCQILHTGGLNFFYRYNSLRAMANYLHYGSPFQTLHSKTPNFDYPSLYFIHSITGSATNDYRNLIEKLSGSHNWPMYGINARYLAEPNFVYADMQDLAKDYADILLAEQKTAREHPFILIGWSAGGIITNAVAHELTKRECRVAIIIIDSIAPSVINNNKLLFQKKLQSILKNKGVTNPKYAEALGELTYDQRCFQQPSSRFDSTLFITVGTATNIGATEVDYVSSSFIQELPGNAVDNLGWQLEADKILKINSTHFNILANEKFQQSLISELLNITTKILSTRFRDLIAKHYIANAIFSKLAQPDKICQLDHHFVPVAIKKNNTVIEDYAQIFHDKEVRLIWMEGMPGIGKSLLRKHLLQSWAKSAQEEGSWADFKLMLNLPLRDLLKHKERQPLPTIYEILFHASMGEWPKQAELYLFKLILAKESKLTIGLVLDGFDEIAQVYNEDETIQAWIKQLFSDPTTCIVPGKILVTSRAGYYQQFAVDRLIVNTGFDQNGQKAYIKKYFGEDNHLAFYAFVEANQYMQEISHIPLLLEIMCLLWQKGKITAADSSITKTKLYILIAEELNHTAQANKAKLILEILAHAAFHNLTENNSTLIAEETWGKSFNVYKNQISEGQIIIEEFIKASQKIPRELKEFFCGSFPANIINKEFTENFFRTNFLTAKNPFQYNTGKIEYGKHEFIHDTFYHFLVAYHIKNIIIQNYQLDEEYEQANEDYTKVHDFITENATDKSMVDIFIFATGLLADEYNKDKDNQLMINEAIEKFLNILFDIGTEPMAVAELMGKCKKELQAFLPTDVYQAHEKRIDYKLQPHNSSKSRQEISSLAQDQSAAEVRFASFAIIGNPGATGAEKLAKLKVNKPTSDISDIIKTQGVFKVQIHPNNRTKSADYEGSVYNRL